MRPQVNIRGQMVNSLNYKSKTKVDFTEYPAYVDFYTSFQKNIHNWHLNLNVTINSYVNGNRLDFRYSDIYDNPELRTSSMTKGESVSLRLQIGYVFGNSRVKSVKRSASYISGYKDRLKND